MLTIEDQSVKEQLFARVAALRPDSEHLWGSMDVYQMCAHLGDQLRVVLGEIKTAPAGNLITRTMVKRLVLWGMPAPKGKVKTFPEVDQAHGRGTKPGSLEEDKQKLRALVEQFLQKPASGSFADHAVFGQMTKAEWGRLIFIHIDHHLRQFGV